MGNLLNILARIKMSPTEMAVAVVLVLSVVQALAEFWGWLAAPPG